MIPYLKLARFDHWVKNVFVLPGIVVALALDRSRIASVDWIALIAGLIAIGLVSSSNYVLNELLDAPYDRLHPLKKDRPAAAGSIRTPLAVLEWLVLFAAGLALGWWVSKPVAYSLSALWVMGLVYNVPPVRAKDVPFLDVLTESVNSPIRFVAGWYLTGTHLLPVTSLLISYWMGGAYLMAIKRYAEVRDLRTQDVLVQYRKGFRLATEQNLLASIVLYGSLAMLFFGAFMGRYRLEMALAFPLVAAVMAIYMALAFKPDSAAQRPEGLIREPWLMAATTLCALAVVALLFADLPWLHELFKPTQP